MPVLLLLLVTAGLEQAPGWLCIQIPGSKDVLLQIKLQ
jgi:hypothetical protein